MAVYEGGVDNRVRIALVAVALVVAVVAAAVVMDDDTAPDTQQAPTVAVTARDSAYVPSEIRLPVGGVAVFTNADDVEHTFTADGGSFDSGRVQPGASSRVPLAAAGVLPFHCEIHPSMTGRIVVGGGS